MAWRGLVVSAFPTSRDIVIVVHVSRICRPVGIGDGSFSDFVFRGKNYLTLLDIKTVTIASLKDIVEQSNYSQPAGLTSSA